MRQLAIAAAGFGVVVLAAVAFLGGQVSRVSPPVPREIYATSVDWDVACATTGADGNPAGCSTPLPTLEPAAVAASVPLHLPAMDIPITSTGHLEVLLGQAVLANGVLHEASFSVSGIETGVQALPPGLEVSGFVRLVVRSTDPSRPPFGNGYARGWHAGVETVNVYLTMDVTRAEPGTVFPIRDVVVN